ncbi:hypothetical protein A0J47_010650 [Photobacterium damselae subsp. damselae]|nr:hypothetical protein A0J47_010650 [Photobacterium damselae subsp. damselae]
MIKRIFKLSICALKGFLYSSFKLMSVPLLPQRIVALVSVL